MSLATFPPNFETKLYAGVLGKIIGVYLGRPFEQWSHERIMRELGEITYYVHDKLGQPLIVTDDDITGTFTFIRALEDEDFPSELTSTAIGNAWLNYLIDRKTILWWGGVGHSTEHTAYHRLKNGIKAPLSGSAELNGTIVAEQIGAQIFIDGWGLICPGDPARAARYAEEAGKVSHDGEAIYGAQAVAAMVALAFIHDDIFTIISEAQKHIPADCLIAKLTAEVLSWNREDTDYIRVFKKIDEKYGYGKFGGGCHMVPNHSLIIHALAHSRGDFDLAMRVVNTCGWDTDCNAANVGCILGVMHGLDAFEKTDWRGPVRDRLFLPTSDGGRCVSDAVQESNRLIAFAHKALQKDYTAPKGGARYSFNFPGSTQGFSAGQNQDLGLVLTQTDQPQQTLVQTWTTAEDRKMGGYAILASPILNQGQTVTFDLEYRGESPIEVEFIVETAGGLVVYHQTTIAPLHRQAITALYNHPETPCKMGLRIPAGTGELKIHSVDIVGIPTTTLAPASMSPDHAEWISSVDDHSPWAPGFRLAHGNGNGLYLWGCREWTGYTLDADITITLAKHSGLVFGCQGQRRFYAAVVAGHSTAQIIRVWDDETTILASAPTEFEPGTAVSFSVQIQPDQLRAKIGKAELSAKTDSSATGSFGFVISEGRMDAPSISIR